MNTADLDAASPAAVDPSSNDGGSVSHMTLDRVLDQGETLPVTPKAYLVEERDDGEIAHAVPLPPL